MTSQVSKIVVGFYFSFAKERVKWRFFTSNISRSNVILRRRQHFARELRAERGCFTKYQKIHARSPPGDKCGLKTTALHLQFYEENRAKDFLLHNLQITKSTYIHRITEAVRKDWTERIQN
jgi:hypothetical protein